MTISQARAAEFKNLTRSDPDATIPNGLDLAGACNITPEVAKLVRDDLATSIILFYPTRILARKNIAFALQIVGALRDIGLQVRLLVSGAPDSHNRSSAEHFAGADQLRLVSRSEQRDDDGPEPERRRISDGFAEDILKTTWGRDSWGSRRRRFRAAGLRALQFQCPAFDTITGRKRAADN